MRRAAIVSPVRTPVGAFGGALRDVPVETLGSVVTKAVLERTGLDPAWIEDVTFAQSYANSETPCVGRWIALEARLPIEVPGLQTDRRCGGGLQAIATAAMMVQTGACDVVLAGGVESMSRSAKRTIPMTGPSNTNVDAPWEKHALGNVAVAQQPSRHRRISRPDRRWRGGVTFF